MEILYERYIADHHVYIVYNIDYDRYDIYETNHIGKDYLIESFLYLESATDCVNEY